MLGEVDGLVLGLWLGEMLGLHEGDNDGLSLGLCEIASTTRSGNVAGTSSLKKKEAPSL